MMKLLFKIVYLVLVILLCVYLIPASPPFPDPPDGAKQSFEPADTETPLRRAYFTNFTRDEVVGHYKRELKDLPTLRLNYPPEEAQTIIRDQTRSSYLEELARPLRESIYINGFVPKEQKDAILIEGVSYYQKITVRYVPSDTLIRVVYALFVSIIGYVLIPNLWRLITLWIKSIIKLFKR
jgi:hypothetical protein